MGYLKKLTFSNQSTLRKRKEELLKFVQEEESSEPDLMCLIGDQVISSVPQSKRSRGRPKKMKHVNALCLENISYSFN